MSKAHWFIKDFEKRCSIQKTSKKGNLLSSLHHLSTVDGSLRQKRLERRRSVMDVLSVIVNEIDFDTMAWGKWFVRHDGTTDFYTRGIEYLKDKTGYDIKTIKRTLSDMEKAGYMISERSKAIGKDGKEIRYYSLRKLTTKLFKEMGFKNSKIEGIMSWKRKKNQSTFYTKKPSTNLKEGLGRLGSLLKKFSAPSKSNSKQTITKSIPKHRPALSPVDSSNLAARALDIAKSTGRAVSDVYKELMLQTC